MALKGMRTTTNCPSLTYGTHFNIPFYSRVRGLSLLMRIPYVLPILSWSICVMSDFFYVVPNLRLGNILTIFTQLYSVQVFKCDCGISDRFVLHISLHLPRFIYLVYLSNKRRLQCFCVYNASPFSKIRCNISIPEVKVNRNCTRKQN